MGVYMDLIIIPYAYTQSDKKWLGYERIELMKNYNLFNRIDPDFLKENSEPFGLDLKNMVEEDKILINYEDQGIKERQYDMMDRPIKYTTAGEFNKINLESIRDERTKNKLNFIQNLPEETKIVLFYH